MDSQNISQPQPEIGVQKWIHKTRPNHSEKQEIRNGFTKHIPATAWNRSSEMNSQNIPQPQPGIGVQKWIHKTYPSHSQKQEFINGYTHPCHSQEQEFIIEYSYPSHSREQEFINGYNKNLKTNKFTLMSVLCKLTIQPKPNPLFSTITQLKLFFLQCLSVVLRGGGV